VSTLSTGSPNRHLRARLYHHPPGDAAEAKRRCQRTSRLITKLRGHSLVAKVPRRDIYRVTPYAQRVVGAAVAVHNSTFPATYLKLSA